VRACATSAQRAHTHTSPGNEAADALAKAGALGQLLVSDSRAALREARDFYDHDGLAATIYASDRAPSAAATASSSSQSSEATC
jgi:hypothetical protein